MKLNYLEKNILIAEKDYRTLEDKLKYVNARLKRVTLVKEGKDTIIQPNENSKKPITKSTYYRKLGELTKKAKDRGQTISKNYLFDLINEHDTLVEDRKELREIIQIAQSLGKIHTIVMAKKEQIDLGRRILSVSELIKTIMEDPDLEDAEQIERQIQLLTVS